MHEHFFNCSKATKKIASAVASGPPVVTTGRMSIGETGTVWPEPAICTPKNSPRSPSGGEARDQSFVTLRHPSPTLQTQVGKRYFANHFCPRVFSYIGVLLYTQCIKKKMAFGNFKRGKIAFLYTKKHEWSQLKRGIGHTFLGGGIN